VIRPEWVPSDRAIQLADLAKRLRLTPLETDFALALAADPKGNQIRAAVAAGVSRRSGGGDSAPARFVQRGGGNRKDG
jgi:hypothetical protein